MENKILDSVNSTADLKKVPAADIPQLCGEIREFLIEKVNKTGGHLASNLGVVELTVAMHRVFNSPEDHIVFDVGHQAYTHKILTGRKDMFDSLRRPGGISGFTKMSESEHDAFGAGHSSTSISAALGFAEADKLNGKGSHTVCIIGDGAYTGGMVHEALNNCKRNLNLIIILNENRMSISTNKGAFASYLAKVRISKGYTEWKAGTNSFLSHLGAFGRGIQRFLRWTKNKLKKAVYKNNYFEDLGLYYIGPVDGNDYKTIEKTLEEAKRLGRCVVIHTYTKKGKGYQPAEKSPDHFHNVQNAHVTEKKLRDAVAEELLECAKEDESIIAVTAAMGIGTGLSKFEQIYPKRYFDVGIAEEHALTFGAGLAAAGMKPYVAIYSTFLQRGYDNIVHDIALQGLPVRLLIDRAGIAVGDGATHHGIFDVAFLSHIPGITLVAPVTYNGLRTAIRNSAECVAPYAIRYSNSIEIPEIADKFFGGDDCDNLGVKADFSPADAPEFVFITYGNITAKVIEAQNKLVAEGKTVGIILTELLKPIDTPVKEIAKYLSGTKKVLFVEEGILNGGFGMICSAKLREEYPEFSNIKFGVAAVDDNFATLSFDCDAYDSIGLSCDKLYDRMISL